MLVASRPAEENAKPIGPEGEREWQRLRRQFELASDPWLGFIFCPARGPVAALRQRTEFTLQYRARQLRRITPASPEELRNLTPRLFDLAKADCVWVEAIVVDGPLPDGEVGSWVAAWDWLMRRLNERRDALRRQLGGALLFAVHPNWKPRVREAAPDFWSVRSLVLDVPGEKSVPSTRDPTLLAKTAEVDDGIGDASSVVDALAAVDRLAAQPAPDPQSLARRHMRAASALLAADRAGEAAEQADLALVRLQDRNTRLHAQALALAARTKRADNDVAVALNHLQEAVAIWRLILDKDGEMPQTLRDLSLALYEMSDLYVDVVDLTRAKATCVESLALDRRLVATTGETPESLRDLSVSLNRIGDLQSAAGDAASAKAAWEESLALRRRLVATTGEAPESLRDLSVSLNRIGDLHSSAGDAASAKAAWEESLALHRRLVATTGETLQSLRDLSVSLNRIGNLHSAAGDAESAKAAWEESLALHRRLVATTGEVPDSLRDLSVSLERMGGLHLSAGDAESAKAAWEESLALRRRLVATTGETPQSLRDLSVVLSRIGDLHSAAGDAELAKAACEESLALTELVNARTTPTAER